MRVSESKETLQIQSNTNSKSFISLSSLSLSFLVPFSVNSTLSDNFQISIPPTALSSFFLPLPISIASLCPSSSAPPKNEALHAPKKPSQGRSRASFFAKPNPNYQLRQTPSLFSQTQTLQRERPSLRSQSRYSLPCQIEEPLAPETPFFQPSQAQAHRRRCPNRQFPPRTLRFRRQG